jgi:hypothetical protein
MSVHPFHTLTTFLKQLEHGHIHYTLASHRDDTIMVCVTVPGERWEIEFLGDGSVEVERFISSGEIGGEEVLAELWTQYVDQELPTLGKGRVWECWRRRRT